MMSEEVKQSRVLAGVTENDGLQKIFDEQDDEINLIDIFRFLKKRKNIILGIALLCTLAGSIYAFSRTEVYSYSTAIQIGSLSINGSEKPLALAKSLSSEIKELIIPSVVNEYYQKNPKQKRMFSIEVSVPKDSEIIVLSSKNSEKDSELYKNVLTSISEKLMAEQNKKVDQYKEQLATQIESAKNRFELLKASEDETKKRIDNFQKLFKKSPIDNSGTTSLVITELFGQLQDMSNEKFKLETLIAGLENDHKYSAYSGLLSPISRSLEPVNSGKAIVTIASFVIGLTLGLFTALIQDFIEKIKAEIETTP